MVGIPLFLLTTNKLSVRFVRGRKPNGIINLNIIMNSHC